MELDTRPAATRTATLAVIATDGELLMRFRRHRDEAAFAEVVERHGRLVWLVCKQALRHHQDVEDAFQATFLILAQRANTIRASDSAAAWLYRVAQRTAIAARRKRDRRREEPLAAEPPQGEEALPVIHDRQMIYVLMEELRALPERYQTPLVLRYFEGQSRRAIAEQTDSTLAQIQGRLVRGRRMLRSRLIRRGVSLSLAAGAVAAANTSASAAVSPSFVAATAACSSSFITSGATGGASPAAVELAKQGLNAMWYASLTKTVGVTAGILIAAGALWAAQSGDNGLANVTVGQAATNGIDLQATVAAAVDEEEPSEIVVAVAAAEPAKAGVEKPDSGDVVDLSPTRQFELERDHWLLKAKAYRMKAKLMRASAAAKEGPPITEADAMLLEADANMAEAKAMELAREAAVRKASASGAATADEVAEGEVKMFSLLNSDASDLLLMLQEQFGAGPLKFSADARTNSIVAQGPANELAVVEALLMRLDSTSDQQKKRDQNTEQVQEIDHEIEKLEALWEEINPSSWSVDLENFQLEQALLQRELEQLHEIQLQINSPLATTPGAGENNLQVQGDALEQLREEVQKRINRTKDRWQNQLKKSSRIAAEYEAVKREQLSIERQLEHLNNRKLQLVFPQDSSVNDPIQVRQLQATIQHLETELASRNAQLERAAQNVARATMDRYGTEDSSADSVVKPGDTIRIEALNVLPNVPIDDVYQVEAMGTVALGATYGRVKVAGLTILQTEDAIKKHLAEKFENPVVQVTMGDKAMQGSSFSFSNVPRTAAAGDLESGGELRALIEALRTENARLQQEIVQLNATAESQKTLMAELRNSRAENAVLRKALKKGMEELRKELPAKGYTEPAVK